MNNLLSTLQVFVVHFTNQKKLLNTSVQPQTKDIDNIPVNCREKRKKSFFPTELTYIIVIKLKFRKTKRNIRIFFVGFQKM